MSSIARFVRLASGLLLTSLISPAVASSRPLEGVVVLTTAPSSYSVRLEKHLVDAGAEVLSCPTVETDFLSDSGDILKFDHAIENVQSYDYVAFTSRRGIQAKLRHAKSSSDLVSKFSAGRPFAIALGVDAEALISAGVAASQVLVPSKPTPKGIVELLESRIPDPSTRASVRILCPIPKVVDLQEPPVVPDFLSDLRSLGLNVDAVPAYVTRWPGPSHSTELAMKLLMEGGVTVIAVSSTAEVEGLLEYITLNDIPKCVRIVAHGPVTAAGAEALGLPVDEVSDDPSSFAGMVPAIARSARRRTERIIEVNLSGRRCSL